MRLELPYLQTIKDYFEDQGLVIPEDNDANTLYEELEANWFPNNRFPIHKILGDDLPDFIVWLQEKIDEEQPDFTETISFTPKGIERDESKENQIIETEIELLEARKELLDLQIAELEESRVGLIPRIKSFIRNIFGG